MKPHVAIVLAASILAAALVVSSIVRSGRYVTRTTGSSTYVVDRFSGEVKRCDPGGCEVLRNVN